MTGFDNYKNTNYKKDNIMKIYDFLSRTFNYKVRKIILNSFLAFFSGAIFTFSVFYCINKFNAKPDGIGGLETSAVPEFTESIEKENIENLEKVASDKTIITGEDSLDSISSIFDEDLANNSNSQTLELCYFPYKLKKGDMISFIAEKFNITQDTIISVNNIKKSRTIQIGQILKIPSMPGIVYTVKSSSETIQSISDKYEVSAQKCARVNSLDLEEKLTPGKSIFIPDAQLDRITRQEINGDLFRKPIKARYYTSSKFGWRASPFTGKRSYHSGIDMACPKGTKVYAALDGKVSTVGYNNVYGNYIIITHHSGYKTLYAHLNKTLVIQGKYVAQGDRIGEVGSTGLSTGPHLHFTVFKFGKTVNPQTLWK